MEASRMSTKEVYLDEDTLKVPGLAFAIISFVGPQGAQKCDHFGLKIRGAFETYEQASEHAKRLSKVDPAFDVYVVDMYRWISAPPDPNLINKKVYNDPTLNTLMESYEEEQKRAKEIFDERKAIVMKDGLEALPQEESLPTITEVDPKEASSSQEASSSRLFVFLSPVISVLQLLGVLLVLGGILIYTSGDLRLVRGVRKRLQGLPARMDAATAALRAADAAKQAAAAAQKKTTVEYLPSLDMFYKVKISMENGKKRSIFPRSWAHLTSVEKWQQSIDSIICSSTRGCNGIAILTGISDCFVLDIDTTSDSKKRSGMELWNRLVAEHGEPVTLRAKTGSGGLHYYFSASNTPRLKKTRNFATIKYEGETYGIDGRGVGGVVFCPPSTYTDEEGRLYEYTWDFGEPRLGCNPMPDWLTSLVNAQGGQIAPALPDPDLALPSAALSIGALQASHQGPARADPVQSGVLHDAIAREIKELLYERAGDSTSRCTTTIDHGPYGTFYCFRVQGPRTCFFGQAHDGSNNYSVLKRGKKLLYRCHGATCSRERVRSLGDLSLEAALSDAGSEPVDESADDTVFNFRDMSTDEQTLLLKLVADNIPENYTGLGRIFGYIYAKEGRILVTDAKKYFYVWAGQRWVRDDGNRVVSTFCTQMARLLKWYDRQREALTKKKLVERGLCSEDEAITSVIATMRKRAGKDQIKEVEDLLFEPDLLSFFDRNLDIVCAPNGILDLRTGRLSAPHPSHMCSRSVGTRYMGLDYLTSRFHAFVMDIFNSELEVVEWMQLFLGYCLTGHTLEEMFCILYGVGANGKGALKQALAKAFGTYYTVMNKDCFIKPGGKRAEGAATSHIMQLKGTRFAVCDESEERQQINGALIKETTGGGAMTARDLFSKSETFVPTHKPVLLTNHKPDIADADEGLLRRLCLVPFVNCYKPVGELDPNNPLHKPQDSALKDFLESEEGARQTLVWKLKEERISQLLTTSGIDFKREHHIDFGCLQGTFARPDFIILMGGKVIVVEVDEFQHEAYGVACEVSRMLRIYEAWMLEGNGLPVHFIRYNPDPYQVDGTRKRVLRRAREARLLEAIHEASMSTRDGLQLRYMYYDIEDGQPVIVQDPAFTIGDCCVEAIG
ncbi:hypothetical protein KFL_008480050 [Klebsormidium nitens]|uniref:SF3 helicase domain-containing protein n=1 Tax=Klebsormidium nitens TaxID=105231 RepID=A0A1Y1ILU6_KLENI|nr:hypothetical protein KFL_008480050 [Klebsormidium nitens]|eukprot:GAQ91764.1 hypothetical protein KFL_008480050 [Klebsormidium nitens]